MLPEVKRQRTVLYKRRLRQQRQSYSEKQKQQSVTSSNNMLKQAPRHSKSKIYRYHLDGIPRPVGPKHKNPSDFEKEESRKVILAMAELEKERKNAAEKTELS